MTRRARSALQVTVVTSGHLSTCPRMLKAADALCEAGHSVRMIATRHEPWATVTDDDVRARRSLEIETIEYRKGVRGSVYWRSGVRYRVARAIAHTIGPSRTPLSVASRAFGRVHSELVAAAMARPADVIYGGTTGALAAVAEAARRLGVPYGVDLEDLHTRETLGAEAAAVSALAARIERAVLRDAAFVTTSSEAIAAEYARAHDVHAEVVHNTFPLPSTVPTFGRKDPARLRLYWFSQTIGGGRGLEYAIDALGHAGIPAQLTLRGRPSAGYLDELCAYANARAPLVRMVHQPPASPEAMVDLAKDHDVGLAVEPPIPFNRVVCMSNKALTYILAGLAVALSDVTGTAPLADDLAEGAVRVAHGDVAALAAAFARWFREPRRLECAQRAAWNAAVRRWRWDHPLERDRLCAIVAASVP